MTIGQILEQSGVSSSQSLLLVIGFLVLVVICVKIVGRVSKTSGAGEASSASIASAHQSGAVAGPVIASIIAAVNEYRKDNN